MTELTDKRRIIDRRRIKMELEDAIERLGDPVRARPAILEVLKTALADGRAEVRRRFDDEAASGTVVVRANAHLIDQLIRVIYELATERLHPVANPTKSERLAVVAVGGYGRGELAPHSDIDLLFLTPYKQTPYGEQVVEAMLYLLWDLGLKVGQSTRSVNECLVRAKGDVTIRTALLESRYLWGDQPLYNELRRRFFDEVARGTGLDFVEAKLAERDARHRRLGDSRYVLEPNIKEGKGGLRDLQTLYWIAKYLYLTADVDGLVARGVLTRAEARRFAKAENFLLTVRCHLHYLTDRPDERLTFDVQPEIARRLAYTDHAGTSGVERFMKHYYLVAKDVGDLTRIFCAAIEVDHKKKPLLRLPRFGRPQEIAGFVVDEGRLNVASREVFADDPVALVRLFHASHEHDLEIHPNALKLVTRALNSLNDDVRNDAEANRLFLQLLAHERDSEVALRRMNEVGVLGKLVPDFGRVVGQMQYDMYHVYTVDEHTLFALGILHRIERGKLKDDHPLASEVIHKIQSRRALYVALLCHDIAKGRGGDHSELGEEVVRRLGPRLGLDEEETETAAWLVLHHLAMSDTAFKRDLADAQTIRDFAALVKSPERLRLLLCLTVADIRAVGPQVWNAWKATLLRDLYWATEDHLLGGVLATGRDARVAAVQEALRAELAGWPEEEIAAHMGRAYPAYWLAFDAPTLARQARMMRTAEAEAAPLTVETRVERARGVTEFTVYAQDHPGMFMRLAGAFAAAGASVVDAKVFTTPQGMALDVFWLQDAERGAFDRPDRLARLSVLVERSLGGALRTAEVMAPRSFVPARTKVFKVPPRVFIDNEASRTYTVLELNGRDRPGLLYDVALALRDLSLQIGSAKISTYGEHVVDVFYVKDAFGMKLSHETKQKRVRERLLAALADPCAPAEPKPVAPAKPAAAAAE